MKYLIQVFIFTLIFSNPAKAKTENLLCLTEAQKIAQKQINQNLSGLNYYRDKDPKINFIASGLFGYMNIFSFHGYIEMNGHKKNFTQIIPIKLIDCQIPNANTEKPLSELYLAKVIWN